MGVDKILFDMEKRALKKEEEAKKEASRKEYSSNSTIPNSPALDYSSLNSDSDYTPKHGFDGCVITFSVFFIAGVICLNLWASGFPISHYIANFYNYVASEIGYVPAAIVFGTISLPLGYIFFIIREKKRILYGYLEIGFGIFSAILTVGDKNQWSPVGNVGNTNLITYAVFFASIYIIVRGFDNLQTGRKQIKACEDLLKSSEQNQIDTVKYLLESGVDVNCQSSEGHTPLMKAVEKGNIEIVQLLLKKEVDKELRNKDGDTALKIAEKNNNAELVNLLKATAVSS